MKKSVLITVFVLSLVLIGHRSLTMSSGPPESYSDAPGEGNCANPGCHGGTAVTSGIVWNDINLSVAGTTLSNLLSDSTYTFTLSFANPASVKYGFQLCVLPTGASALTTSLGTLINTSTETQLISSPNRTYLEHTSSGTSAIANAKSWSFDWQVPTGYTGGAVFYVVVNSTNNDGSSGGDVIYSKTFTASVSLPVTWLSFEAKRTHKNVLLKWVTGSETNADLFTVERSFEGKDWEAIGTVKASGNSSTKREYVFTDDHCIQLAYYRLKQLDYNGTFSYSEVVSAPVADWASFITFNQETNELYKTDGKIGQVDLYSNNGTIVWSTNCQSSSIVLPVLPRGIYFLRSDLGIKKILL